MLNTSRIWLRVEHARRIKLASAQAHTLIEDIDLSGWFSGIKINLKDPHQVILTQSIYIDLISD